jgi:hypothetical protein
VRGGKRRKEVEKNEGENERPIKEDRREKQKTSEKAG